MRTLRSLMIEAGRAARQRGHEMEPWQHYSDSSDSGHGVYAAGTECKHCGAVINVNTRPAANGIEIAGRAVAVNCTK